MHGTQWNSIPFAYWLGQVNRRVREREEQAPATIRYNSNTTTAAASSALQQQLINNRIYFIYRTTNANRLTSKTVSACIYKKALLGDQQYLPVSLTLTPSRSLFLLLIGPQIDQATDWATRRSTIASASTSSQRIASHRIATSRTLDWTKCTVRYSPGDGGNSRGSEGRSFGFSGFILGALMRFACIWSHSVDAYQRVSINCGDAY